jgi:hypothetical protein
MKTHLRSLLRLGVACAALAGTAVALHAADENSEQNTVRSKFSDPSKPGTLKVSLPWAEVHVTGGDGNEIVVTSTLEQKGKKEVDKDGFRRLDEDVSFEVVEKNNVATIIMSGDNLWAAHGAEFHVQVPRNTSLILRTEAGGDVNVENIDGEIDINSMNGEVTLTDIGSSAVVNTMNGEITANFKKAPTKPVSITSMNGEIDVRLPSDTKANLRMRTHNGSIRTNFPDGVLQAKTEKTGGSRHWPMSRDDIRNIEREASRAAREAARAVRGHVARSGDDDDDDKDTDKISTPTSTPTATNTTTNTPGKGVETRTRNHDGSVTVVRSNDNAVPAVAPVPPVPPAGWGGGKSITGTLNGGGIDIQLSTMNGTITLRQSK